MNKKVLLILTLCMMVLLSACSLAQPEMQDAGQEDRFVGIYIVNDHVEGLNPQEYGTWVPDGIEEQRIGLSGYSQRPKRMILPAVYSETEHTYKFPGLKGYALFAAEVKDPSEEYGYTVTCCDLQGGNSKFITRDIENHGIGEEISYHSVTDYDLSGTLYVGDTSFEHNYWRMLNVYQKPDGTVYLDGTGDAYGGGGSIGHEVTEKKTTNGKEIELGRTSVQFTIEEAKEADTVLLYWYGEDGKLLVTRPLDVQGTTQLPMEKGASFLIVEEQFSHDRTRTLYDLSNREEPTVLKIMFLNESGMGEFKSIEIS